MKMIDVKTQFQHGGSTFYVGERRMVDEKEAAYFAEHGWASADGIPAAELNPKDVKLDVQSVSHKTKAVI